MKRGNHLGTTEGRRERIRTFGLRFRRKSALYELHNELQTPRGVSYALRTPPVTGVLIGVIALGYALAGTVIASADA